MGLGLDAGAERRRLITRDRGLPAPGVGVGFVAPWFLDLWGGSGSAGGHPFADRGG
jgi:hypothetical protein